MNTMVYILPITTLLALGAYFKKSLTFSGALCALTVGSFIWYYGGFQGFMIMGIFFISSSILSKLMPKNRQTLHLKQLHDKTDRRDPIQVLANSLVALIALAGYHYFTHPAWYVAFVTAFSAANADTWASEIGVLSKRPPVLLLARKPVQAGLSGGVTLLGFLATGLGSGLIALSAALFLAVLNMPPLPKFTTMEVIIVFVITLLGGILGSLVDSLLGECYQAKYQSKDPLGQITERASGNHLVHGLSWMNNDLVNLLSVGIASLLTGCASLLFF